MKISNSILATLLVAAVMACGAANRSTPTPAPASKPPVVESPKPAASPQPSAPVNTQPSVPSTTPNSGGQVVANAPSPQLNTGGGTKRGGGTTAGVNNTVSGLVFNTTVAAEMQYQGSGCAASPNTPSYCNGAMQQFVDNYPNTGAPIITNPYNPTPFRVGRGRGTNDIRMLTNFSGLIFLHTQLWFCNTGSSTTTRDAVTYKTCGGHLQTGYNSDDPNYVNAAVEHMWQLGYDGIFSSWGGGQSTCTYPNFTSSCGGSADARRDRAQALFHDRMKLVHPTMKMGLIYDESALKFGGNCGLSDLSNDQVQPDCVTRKLLADIKYAYDKWVNVPGSIYVKTADGKMIFGLFVCETCTVNFNQCTATASCTGYKNTCTSASGCWNDVWRDVVNDLTASGRQVVLMFRQRGGFSHTQSAGSFCWIDPNRATGSSITTATQIDWKNGSFYDDCMKAVTTDFPTKIGMFNAKKGMDTHNAGWYYPNGNVTSQRCGQTWLDSWKFNDNRANMDYIQTVTWDDHEEGSAIEPGIDNCYADPTFTTIVGSSLVQVNLNPTDNTYSGFAVQNNTIKDIRLYVSTDGINLAFLDFLPIPPAANFVTVDMSKYPDLTPGTTYQLFVKTNGKANIRTHMNTVGYSFTR